MSKNVLIVAQSFPPLANMAARRFGYMTPHMAACGWTPWVLTTEAEGPLPLGIPEEQVIRVGRHPQMAGARDDAAGHDAPPVADSPWRGLSPAVDRLRRTVAAAGIRLRALDYTCFTWLREASARRQTICERLPRIDLVLGTFGPAAAIRLAARLAGQFHVPWVADFRDLAALRPDGRGRLSQQLDRWIERTVLRSAAGITTVSPTLAAILSETYRRPTEVVYNGFEPSLWANAALWPSHPEWSSHPLKKGATAGLSSSAKRISQENTAGQASSGTHVSQTLHFQQTASHPDVGAPIGDEGASCEPPCPEPYLYYAGRWYPERVRAARLVLDALARRPGLRWLVRSLGPTSAERDLHGQAVRLGVADRLDLRPPCGPDQVFREADAALANLVLDDVDCAERWSRGTLTGKFLELVAARPAVLAVTRPDSDMGAILRQTGKGVICPDAESLNDFVGRLGREPACCRGDRQAIESFSKPRQAAVLCRFFDRLAAPCSLRRAA